MRCHACSGQSGLAWTEATLHLLLECALAAKWLGAMQERPEEVPTGELPQNMTLIVDRHLVGKISPGTRVTVIGIYSIYQVLFDLHFDFKLFHLLEWHMCCMQQCSVQSHTQCCARQLCNCVCDMACPLCAQSRP